MTEAPTNEPVDQGWTRGWILWLKGLQLALSGWRASRTVTDDVGFGTIVAHTRASAAVEVKGARVMDGVQVTAYPNISGLAFSGSVTSDDTVTIYAQNVTATDIGPPVISFRVIVFQQ